MEEKKLDLEQTLMPVSHTNSPSQNRAHLPILTSLSLRDLWSPWLDVQALGTRATHGTAESQEVPWLRYLGQAEGPRRVSRFLLFPGPCEQVLPASGLPVQLPLWILSGLLPERTHVPWTAADLSNYTAPLLPLSGDPTVRKINGHSQSYSQGPR